MEYGVWSTEYLSQLPMESTSYEYEMLRTHSVSSLREGVSPPFPTRNNLGPSAVSLTRTRTLHSVYPE